MKTENENNPRKPVTGTSAKLLKDKREEILSLWEERCLKEVPSAGTGTSLALRNSVPLYLDHLSEALSTNLRMDFKSVFKRDKEAGHIGRLHGADRASNRSYMLTEVIFEYHILREVIVQVLEVDGPMPELQRGIVLDSIDQAVNDAAVEFSEVHTDIQQKFVNTLTHDLKSPITAAKMNAQLMLKGNDIPPAVSRAANRVLGNMNRLENMIHDLLDASRLRVGEQLSLQFVQCDLEALIRDVVDEMSVLYGDRFLFDAQGAVEGKWGCDGIRRAVENLIGNAVKYGTPNTPITISLRRLTSSIELDVHNQGTPIPSKEVPLLFQDFRRAKSAQEGTETGWGLGLTLVKGVLAAHNGKVRVDSSEGKGTSFILEFPYPVVVPEVKDKKSA